MSIFKKIQATKPGLTGSHLANFDDLMKTAVLEPFIQSKSRRMNFVLEIDQIQEKKYNTSIFFGIVEGITEWLPVSSTGHLILVQQFINLDQSQDFMDMFNIVIQLGAILAVIVIYFERLNPFQPGKTAREVRLTWQLWLKVAVACIPSIVIALPLDDWFEAHFNYMIPIAIALIFYGIVFIWIEKRNANVTPKVTELARMSYKTAFLIGCFQVLSIVPGTSRSGATILGAIILGTSRSVAADFTFFLAIPTNELPVGAK